MAATSAGGQSVNGGTHEGDIDLMGGGGSSMVSSAWNKIKAISFEWMFTIFKRVLS